MNENIIKKIKTLPPLPKSVIEIQRITSDPEGSIADLIKVVKEDPMLTANLLKAANSPLYGFSRQIKNVDQAVSLFGMSTVKGFAVASAVRNSMKIDLSAYGISESQFVSISQLQNALIVNWYKRDRSKLDILSTASFLLEIGAVVISSILVAEGLADEFKSRLASEDRRALEEEYLETNTIAVTAEIFNYWKFDPALVNAIKFVNDLDNAEENIDFSAPLAVTHKVVDMFNPFNEQSLNEGLELANKYNLNTEALNEAIETIK
jgi:HD-like signal output (HDOD) protein